MSYHTVHAKHLQCNTHKRGKDKNAGILWYHGAHIGKETLATIKDPSKIIATSSAAAAAAAAVTTSSANTLAEGNVCSDIHRNTCMSNYHLRMA